MRIIVPHAYNVPGGVEKVTLSLVRELSGLIDAVILVLPPANIPGFQRFLPASRNLIYESFAWLPNESGWHYRFLNFSRRLFLWLKKSTGLPLATRVISSMDKKSFDLRLRYLCRKHKATHCLYMVTSGQPAPRINVPLAVFVHDLFWNYKPERFPEDFRRKRNENLRDWAEKAGFLFAISEFTRNNALKVAPGAGEKIKVVYLAGDIEAGADSGRAQALFYYPASGIAMHKNLSLFFKAAQILAKKSLDFKIIVTGKDTQKLAGQEPLKPRQDEEARLFYQEHKDVLGARIDLRGYCSREELNAVYSECSCVVLPSQLESSSILPLVEAITKGLPVICSDIEEHQEYVRLYKCADMARMFRADNPGSLAALLEEFMADPRKCLTPSEIKERFSHWTWRDVAKGVVSYLEKAGLRG